MPLTALTRVLEALPDPAYCQGTLAVAEPPAVVLPDGDLCSADDPIFVDWLTAHGEPAPFGHGKETKLDSKVRTTTRLSARHRAKVTGFDPTAVLPAIEAALSPSVHLDARLEDVLVYPIGGMFARHKDTPRTDALVGTLIVGLPIAHDGGAFEIADGHPPVKIDWSGPADRNSLRWVALFSDVDHAISQVTSGARVTLVYSLSRSDRPRLDATRDARLASLRELLRTFEIPEARFGNSMPLLIACTRQVISAGAQPQAIATLRGTDREIAEAFAEAGFAVGVRACVFGEDVAARLRMVARLRETLPADVIGDLGDPQALLSFTDEIDISPEEYMTDDDDSEVPGAAIGPFVLDIHYLDDARWLARTRAARTLLFEGTYSDTGLFGNEANDGPVYTLAAIEVAPKRATRNA